MIARVLFVLLAFAAFVAADARAQPPLTLAQAQAEARANAPDSAEAQARIAGAEGIALQARRVLTLDPTISTSVFQGALVGRPDEGAWNVGVRQPVDVSHAWRPRAASAAADVERAQQDAQDVLRALDEGVAIAVADLALAQRLIARGERITTLAAIASDAARRQFEAGGVPQIDADAAELDLAATRFGLEQARGDLDRARARLARLLGRTDWGGLIVQDPVEPLDVPARTDTTAVAARDPRVLAVEAEVRAAQFERQMFERLARPMPTLGLDVGREQRDIPAGGFTGTPFAGGLTANWHDANLVFSVSVPVPLFNRQREPRARATARILAAEARVRIVRADVRSELESSWSTVAATARAYDTVAGTEEIIERDAGFIENAVRAGAFDATTRTQALRRLEEAGRRLDLALRDLRAARAAWIRRTVTAP